MSLGHSVESSGQDCSYSWVITFECWFMLVHCPSTCLGCPILSPAQCLAHGAGSAPSCCYRRSQSRLPRNRLALGSSRALPQGKGGVYHKCHKANGLPFRNLGEDKEHLFPMSQAINRLHLAQLFCCHIHLQGFKESWQHYLAHQVFLSTGHGRTATHSEAKRNSFAKIFCICHDRQLCAIPTLNRTKARCHS